MRVKLQFESPLLIGDKRLVSNYISSKDYIQGSVVRAAFARVILNQCQAYHGEVEDILLKNQTGTEITVQKKNWIHCRGEEKQYQDKCKAICQKCCYHDICLKFSKMTFSFFYPQGTSPIPLTSMVCKNKPLAHGFIDSLTEERVCPCCKKIDAGNARVEFESGLRNKEGKYKVEKLVQTKTGINPYTKTAEDGMLYTLESLSPITFEGEIEGMNAQELQLFKVLRVGAYTSTGYGKCRVVPETGSNHKMLSKEQVIQYSKSYKQYQTKAVGDMAIAQEKEYMALLLKADARMQITAPEEYCTTEQYNALWEENIHLPIGKVKQIYFDTTLYRGYDTASVTKEYRGKTNFQINKGSVMVLELKNRAELEKAYLIYSKDYAIGEECQNGYGQCQIYCGEDKTYGK